jgi:hypothetical protein
MNRFLAALLFAFVVAAPPARGEDPIAEAAQRIVAEAGEHQLILLGEMHGTRESPQLVAALAKIYADKGPVTVALEADAGLSRGFDSYVHSDGGKEARAALLAWPYWHVEAQRNDGRRNLAMIEMLEQLRQLQERSQAGDVIEVVGIDNPPFSTPDSQVRDKAMAGRVREAFGNVQGGRVLVLAGNVHAMRSRPSYAPPEMQTPMGAYLDDLKPFAVVLAARAGQHWACGSGPCGPVDERPMAMDSERLPPGDAWDLRVVLPSFSLAELIPAAASSPDGQADEFLRRLAADPEQEWFEESGQEWLAQLPKEARVRVAEKAMASAEPMIQTIGAMQYYAMGMDERGDSAVAELAVRGVDTTGFGWGWMHSGEAGLLERRLAGVRKALKERYPQLTAEQRKRADELLQEP